MPLNQRNEGLSIVRKERKELDRLPESHSTLQFGGNVKNPTSAGTLSGVTKKILNAGGRPVSFHYPAGEKHKQGRLVSRAVVRSNPRTRSAPYWDVIDLIKYEKEKHPDWIRIGYCRLPKGRLQWGSQTTITEPIKTWERILIGTAKQKPWFRELLVSVVAQLRK